MIESNIKEIIAGLNDFEKTQLPYATKVALNATAEIAMKAMKKSIDDSFDVTASWNRVGGKHGIKKRAATKSNLEVEIFIPDSNTWIEDHEKGDVRTHQLIPTKEFKKLFPSLKTNRAIKKKAQTLLGDKSKNRIFEAPIKSGSSTMALFQRKKGKVDGTRIRKSKNSSRTLKSKKILNREAIPLFVVKESVKETKRLAFFETITSAANGNIKNEFSKAISYALQTMKVKS